MLLFVPLYATLHFLRAGSSGPVVCLEGDVGSLPQNRMQFRGVTGGVGEASEWSDRASQVFEQNC